MIIMFKYQTRTIDEIKKVAENLEKITDKRKRICIGYIRETVWNGNEWRSISGDLFIRLNSKYRFGIEDENDFSSFYIVETDFIDNDAYLDINKNIFLKLNDWISNIFEDERKRKQFHEKLNEELKALNKSL